MIIDFKSMEDTVLEKFKGGEKELCAKMYFDGTDRIMLAKLIPGASIGMHIHDTNCEILYVLEGEGKVIYGDGEERVKAGQCHFCPQGHSHSLINDTDSDLIFFAAVPQK